MLFFTSSFYYGLTPPLSRKNSDNALLSISASRKSKGEAGSLFLNDFLREAGVQPITAFPNSRIMNVTGGFGEIPDHQQGVKCRSKIPFSRREGRIVDPV